MAYRLAYTRSYPADIAESFDRLLASSLREVFARRYGPIAPVREVRGQDGAWRSAGQTRTVVTTDGATMHETLTAVERPTSFEYLLTGFTGPLKLLLRQVRGRWTFESVGTGVRVTWTWDVEPRGRLGAWAEGAVTRLWTGYARQAFDEIETVLLAKAG